MIASLIHHRHSIAWFGLLVIALYLRVHDLSDRPIHADEATGARIAAQRLEGDGYQFNPKHFHGPWLSLSTTLTAALHQQSNWEELRPHALRIGPAIAGTLMVLTPLLWLRTLGKASALLAGAFLATSPLLVYYNRMYIHESWLALFGMCSLAAIYQLLERPSLSKAIPGGICLGLMFATKATAAISIMSWAAAINIYLLYRKRACVSTTDPANREITPRHYVKAVATFVLSAAVCASLLLTEAFSRPQALLDAVKTYFVYQTTEGHDKPMTYYLELLIWPKHTAGIWWSEAVIALCAVLVVVFSTRQLRHTRALVFLAVVCLGHILIYSFLSYKTPWLMLLPWAQTCLLAGALCLPISNLTRRRRILGYIALACACSYQMFQSLNATGRLVNDERNPYAYAPTTKDPARLVAWLKELNQLETAPELAPIAVIGSSYWPLPWYLREFDSVGYWTTPPEALNAFPVAIAMPDQIPACKEALAATHTAFPRSLRSNVSITLYLHNDLWEKWMQPVD